MRAATVVLLYVTPEARGSWAAFRLLRAFRRGMHERGVAALSVHVTSGVRTKPTHRLLTRLGFACTGGNYLLALPPASRTAGQAFPSRAEARE